MLTRWLEWRGGSPALAVLVLCSLLLCGRIGGVARPAAGDVPGYMTTAYHLDHDHVFSTQTIATDVRPTLTREPAYPVLLAALMAADPGFAQFTLGCLDANDRCPPRTFRLASLANLLLVELTGGGLFLLGRMVTGRPAGGLAAAAYVLLNLHLNKGWADLMSDRLAMALLTLALLLLACAWRGRRRWPFAAAGAAFAALTLTKAVFLPFCILAWAAASAAAITRRENRRRALGQAAAAGAVYLLIVGGWVARNDAVSGQLRLTDARSAIALSTREVFDHMSPAQYAASLVYWTRGFGPGLARRLFSPATVAPFDLDQPGGFYDLGQNGYHQRVVTLMRTESWDYWQAAHRVDADIMASIRSHWLAYGLTTLPLIYRGIWGDEFIVLGLPCLLWALWSAVCRRDGLRLLLLSTGAYNLVAYAAISLNVPRYQMTAVPAVALAAGLAAARLAESKHFFFEKKVTAQVGRRSAR